MQNVRIPLHNPAKFVVVFKDGNGVTFDPTTNIQIKILAPGLSGAQFTLNYPADVVRDSAGTYSVVHMLDVPGDWIAIGQGSLPNGETITTEDTIVQAWPSYIKF